MTLGVAWNPHATNVADRLMATAARLGVPARLIDLPSLGLSIQPRGQLTVADQHGAGGGQPAWLLTCCSASPPPCPRSGVLARAGRAQNPVDGVLLADDKAATAQRLAQAGVAQVRTEICAQDPGRAAAAADLIGYPVVVKRTHGAQGRWVRRAAGPARLAAALAELAVEGPGALVVQPEVTESAGRSVRAVITGGRLLAVTERAAAARRVAQQHRRRRGAAPGGADRCGDRAWCWPRRARLGLGHAGVDLLRTRQGPRVLEVNSCPDFTSMQPNYTEDLAEAVLLASL